MKFKEIIFLFFIASMLCLQSVSAQNNLYRDEQLIAQLNPQIIGPTMNIELETERLIFKVIEPSDFENLVWHR